MARDENLPFDLGQTYFNSDPIAIAAFVAGGNVQGKNLEGQEYWVEDNDYSTGTIGAQPAALGRKRKVRIVRNMNAAALLPKQLAKMKVNGATPDVLVGQVDGLAATAADKCYPADEWMGAGGCLQYDLCYIVIDGLATVLTATAGDTNFGIGAVVVPGAAGVVEVDPAATGAALINEIINSVGVAAAAVNATATGVVVDVGATKR